METKRLSEDYLKECAHYVEIGLGLTIEQDRALLSHIAAQDSEIKELEETITGCEEEVSKVYCSITEGKFSKMNTDSMYIFGALDERDKRMIDDACAEKDAEVKELREELSNWKCECGASRITMTIPPEGATK